MGRWFCFGKKDFCDGTEDCLSCEFANWEGSVNEDEISLVLSKIFGEDYGLDRLEELVEADRDGRCVVFPCKVGDTLYRIGYTTCKNGETHPDSYGCCGCYDECDMKKCVKEFIIPDSQWILSNYTNIAGRDWYFTREAVEVALKRMEGEEK